MRVIVSAHARERIRQRYKMKVPVQELADSAWTKGKMPNFSAMKYLFWKWAKSEHDTCDIRRYKGYFFFFRQEIGKVILATVYKDTGPKKKEGVVENKRKPQSPKEYLKSVGLVTKKGKLKKLT